MGQAPRGRSNTTGGTSRSGARQFGALPWRNAAHGREILLITTRGSRRWLAPKGKPMPGLPPHEVAAQEAWEEAGVRGVVATTPLGVFEHRKGSPIVGQRVQVELYPLEVTLQAETWPEAHERERRWVSVPEALRLIRSPELRALILAFDAPPAQTATRGPSVLHRLSALAFGGRR